MSVIAALVAAPLHLAQAQSLEASLRMGGVERPPNQQPQDTISPWQTLTAIGHWVKREWPSVRDGAVTAAKATWEGTKWTGKKLWEGIRWVGTTSKNAVCLWGVLCGGGSSALQRTYDANLATRNAARAANTELRSAVNQAEQGLLTARGALQRTLADPAFAAAAGGAQAVRDQLRTLAATQVAQHNAAIAGLDRDLRGNWPQPTVPVANPPVAPPPALDATAQPGPPSLTPTSTPQGRRLAEVQRYCRAADQFAQTSSSYRSERVALVRVAQSTLRFADASFAQGDASVADTLLGAANGVLDNVFSLTQRAGQWLISGGATSFLSGLIHGALGVPGRIIEGFERTYHVGAALGSVAGMLTDLWLASRAATHAAGAVAMVVTAAGVLVPVTLPVALAHAGTIAVVATVTIGVAHFAHFMQSLNEIATDRPEASPGGDPAPRFTEDKFRENLKRLTGYDAPTGIQAHHMFPKAVQKYFPPGVKINIHDPKYGAWWNAIDHNKNWWPFNQDWIRWLKLNQAATVDEILTFGRKLAGKYNLGIYF